MGIKTIQGSTLKVSVLEFHSGGDGEDAYFQKSECSSYPQGITLEIPLNIIKDIGISKIPVE